jgi:hypothetical protein
MASACPNQGILKPLGLDGLGESLGSRGAVWRFDARTSCGRALTKAGQILSMMDAGTLGTGGFSPYQKTLTRLQAEASLVVRIPIRSQGRRHPIGTP